MKNIRKIAAKRILENNFEFIDRFLTKCEEREYHLSPDLFESCLEKTDKEIEEIKIRHNNVIKKYKEIARERAEKVLS